MSSLTPRTTVLLYTEWIDQFQLLPYEEVGMLTMAMLQYQIDGSILELPPAPRMAFSFIRQAVDRANANYDKMCENKQKAGQKGGRTRAENAKFREQQPQLSTFDKPEKEAGIAKQAQAEASITKKAQAEASTAKQAQAETSTENQCQATQDIPNPNHVLIPSPEPKHTVIQRDYAAEFELLWDAYPRKEALEAAKQAYEAVTEPINVLLQAVTKQKQSESWQRDNGRYVPQLAKWLKDARWTDQLPQPNRGYIQHGDPPTPCMLNAVREMLAEPD